MMSLMIKENGVTFKELEKNIYAWICQIGREFTKEFLERENSIRAGSAEHTWLSLTHKNPS